MSDRYDLAAPPRVAPREEPPIAAILMISVIREGNEWSLTLVRSHWRDEGHAIIQRLPNPRECDVDEIGVWRLIEHEGASVLSVEADDPGVTDDDWDQVLDQLMDAITDLPNCWADTFEARVF
jgi:hypothetical protein